MAERKRRAGVIDCGRASKTAKSSRDWCGASCCAADEAEPETEVFLNMPNEERRAAEGGVDLLGEIKALITNSNSELKKEIGVDLRRMVAPMNEQINNNHRTIAENTRAIGEIKVAIGRIEESITKKSQDMPKTQRFPILRLNDLEAGGYTSPGERSAKFNLSRRSLRLWPVCGSEGELEQRTKDFLRNNLKMTADDVRELGQIEIRRIAAARRSKIQMEVLVRFEDKFARDRVSKCAKNLSECVNNDGSPSAGLRLDYPEHLAKDFRALERYGSYLRRTRGSGFKRNYRFCDDTETIYMDVRLPEEEEWLRITAEMAVSANTRRQSKSENDAARKLALSSPPPAQRISPGPSTGANSTVVGRLTNSRTTTSTHHDRDEFPVTNQ